MPARSASSCWVRALRSRTARNRLSLIIRYCKQLTTDRQLNVGFHTCLSECRSPCHQRHPARPLGVRTSTDSRAPGLYLPLRVEHCSWPPAGVNQSLRCFPEGCTANVTLPLELGLHC